MQTKDAKNTQSRGVLLDGLFANATRLMAFFVFILLAAILLSLLWESRDSIYKWGFSFLWTNDWDPQNDIYGAVAPIIGTLITSFIALLIAIPVSFGIAMFLTELSPIWLRRPLGTAVEMLAAIPSIIYGMWGLFIFAPWYANNVQPFIIKTFGNLPLIGFYFRVPRWVSGYLLQV